MILIDMIENKLDRLINYFDFELVKEDKQNHVLHFKHKKYEKLVVVFPTKYFLLLHSDDYRWLNDFGLLYGEWKLKNISEYLDEKNNYLLLFYIDYFNNNKLKFGDKSYDCEISFFYEFDSLKIELKFDKFSLIINLFDSNIKLLSKHFYYGLSELIYCSNEFKLYSFEKVSSFSQKQLNDKINNLINEIHNSIFYFANRIFNKKNYNFVHELELLRNMVDSYCTSSMSASKFMKTNCSANRNNSLDNKNLNRSKIKLQIKQQEHKRSYSIIGFYDNQVLHELVVDKKIDNLLIILNDNLYIMKFFNNFYDKILSYTASLISNKS